MSNGGTGWDFQCTVVIAILSALPRCRWSGSLARRAQFIFLLQCGMFIWLSTQLGCRQCNICLLILIVVAKCKWSRLWCIRGLIAISDFLSWSQILPKPQHRGDDVNSGVDHAGAWLGSRMPFLWGCIHYQIRLSVSILETPGQKRKNVC